MAVTVGATVMRDASGNITDLMKGVNGTVYNDSYNDSFTKYDTHFICANSTECTYGSQNNFQVRGTFTMSLGNLFQSHHFLFYNFQVIQLVSFFGPFIYAGCFAATLSSALASLVSAPKVFQALCRDKLYPYIDWFSGQEGKEPVRGYVLTFVIAVGFVLIGKHFTALPHFNVTLEI